MNKALNKKPTIPAEEWEKLKDDAEAATELLTHPRFKFVQDYFSNAQGSILQTFAKQSINDVCIEQSVGETTKKKLYIPAKKEYSHLAGQYKFIEQFINDMQVIISYPDEARKKMKEGVLEIAESKEGEK